KHNMGSNAFFKLWWEISDYDSKAAVVNDSSNTFNTPWGSGTAKGGLISTQIGVKFNS
ncbi:MAG: hypothetical protein HY248_07210, partial [Fimbriimonas ginsengisoli]|nr:hypothetical protein [Fimbriimonas ginsengisoli]